MKGQEIQDKDTGNQESKCQKLISKQKEKSIKIDQVKTSKSCVMKNEILYYIIFFFKI